LFGYRRILQGNILEKVGVTKVQKMVLQSVRFFRLLLLGESSVVKKDRNVLFLKENVDVFDIFLNNEIK